MPKILQYPQGSSNPNQVTVTPKSSGPDQKKNFFRELLDKIVFRKASQTDASPPSQANQKVNNGSNGETVIRHPIEAETSWIKSTSEASSSKEHARDSGHFSIDENSIQSEEESQYAEKFKLFADCIFQTHEYILRLKTNLQEIDQSEQTNENFLKSLDSLKGRFSTLVDRLRHTQASLSSMYDPLMNNDSIKLKRISSDKWELIKGITSELKANSSDLENQTIPGASTPNNQERCPTQLPQDLLEKIEKIFDSNKSEIDHFLKEIENNLNIKSDPKAAALASPNNFQEQAEVSPHSFEPNETQAKTFSPDSPDPETEKDPKNSEISSSSHNEHNLFTQSDESNKEDPLFYTKNGINQKPKSNPESNVFKDLPPDDELFTAIQTPKASREIETSEANVSTATQKSNSQLSEEKINRPETLPSHSQPNQDTPSTSFSDKEDPLFYTKNGINQKPKSNPESNVFKDLPPDDELFTAIQTPKASREIETSEANVSTATQKSNSQLSEEKINRPETLPSHSQPNQDTPSTSFSENPSKKSINPVLNETHASQSKRPTNPASLRFRESVNKIARSNPPSQKALDDCARANARRKKLRERIARARYHDSSSDEEVTTPGVCYPVQNQMEPYFGLTHNGTMGMCFRVNMTPKFF